MFVKASYFSASLLAFACAAPALAHTSYMLPSRFTANLERMVTVESAFAEDFFIPDVAVDRADFHVIRPDGTRAEFDAMHPHKQLVILETEIADAGTYRFTTGVRRGRRATLALVDGEWIGIPANGAPLPEGTTATKVRETETVADAYLTKKAPTSVPVNIRIGRLVMQPITHPSDAFIGNPFEVRLLFDGKPLAGHVVNVDRDGARYDPERFHQDIATDADGRLKLSFDKAGIYIIWTRFTAAAPPGADVDERSYTTSLTFEAQS